MLIGEARDVATKAAADFGVTEYPTLLVLPAGSGVEGKVAFEGEMKPASLAAETHALDAPLTTGGADSDASSSSGDDLMAIEVTSANVASLVEGEKSAWLLVFEGRR